MADIDRNSSAGRAGHGLARAQRQAARSAVVCIANLPLDSENTKADVEFYNDVKDLYRAFRFKIFFSH